MALINLGGWLLSLFAGIIWLGASYLVVLVVYNLVFHPLAQYPGPLWAHLSPFYAFYYAYRGNSHRNIQSCHEVYGPVVRYAPDRLIFNTAEALKGGDPAMTVFKLSLSFLADIYGHGKIIQKSKKDCPSYHPASEANGHNPIDDEAQGKRQRIVSQIFTTAALTLYEPIILNHVRNLCGTLLKTADVGWPLINKEGWSQPQDVGSWMDYLTLDIISDLVYGQSFNLVTKPDLHWIVDTISTNRCRDRLRTAFPTLPNNKLKTWSNMDRIIFPSLASKWQRFLGLLDQFIKERTHYQDNPLDRVDILFILSTSHDPKTLETLTKTEIQNTAHSLISAGSLPLAAALTTTLHHLSLNPTAYANLVSEIRTTFPTLSSIHQTPLLKSCPYLQSCISESLRLTPPSSFPTWRATGPTGITVAGEHIPAGCEIAVSTWALHQNPLYYPTPSLFNPDRFMPAKPKHNSEREPKLNKPKFDFFPTSRANTIFPTSPSALSPNSFQGMYFPSASGSSDDGEREGRGRGAFRPFGVGNGRCVGEGLARMEMGLVLAGLVWCLDFRAVEGGEGGGEGQGVRLQFRRREGVDVWG